MFPSGLMLLFLAELAELQQLYPAAAAATDNATSSIQANSDQHDSAWVFSVESVSRMVPLLQRAEAATRLRSSEMHLCVLSLILPKCLSFCGRHLAAYAITTSTRRCSWNAVRQRLTYSQKQQQQHIYCRSVICVSFFAAVVMDFPRHSKGPPVVLLHPTPVSPLHQLKLLQSAREAFAAEEQLLPGISEYHARTLLVSHLTVNVKPL